MAQSRGAFGQWTSRNTLAILNLAYDSVMTWDGHAKTIEEVSRAYILKQGFLQGDSATIP